MNINIYDQGIFDRYRSKSQIAGNLSEKWFYEEMYCPNCLKQELEKKPKNTKVKDFICNNCNNEFQLKAQSKPFSSRVNDGAFDPLISAIKLRLNPNFSFMQYSPKTWNIENLFFVPKFFFSRSIIEKRNPLSTTADRAGWIGCNILLCKLPDLGKIKVIENERILPKKSVQKTWKSISFMENETPGKRAWITDVLYCVQRLNKSEFTLSEIYDFENYLSLLHPNNSYIKPKIRQQLQVLRDKGILEFTSRGIYRVKK